MFLMHSCNCNTLVKINNQYLNIVCFFNIFISEHLFIQLYTSNLYFGR
jgi:hypothetical protein